MHVPFSFTFISPVIAFFFFDSWNEIESLLPVTEHSSLDLEIRWSPNSRIYYNGCLDVRGPLLPTFVNSRVRIIIEIDCFRWIS